MHAVAFTKSLPIGDPSALVDVDVEEPVPGPRDLLVRVAAISVNPVDFKVRKRDDPGGKPKVIGFDAAGTVEAVGADVTMFKPGEAVFYAGSVARQGTNAELHLVDERIAGHKPKTLNFAEAAALPLTSLTAWELLFDRIGIVQGEGIDKRSLLIVGGAGGVGSIAIQLARSLTGLTVIATASRPETAEWVASLGAHHVVDHSKTLRAGLADIGVPAPDIVVALAGTKHHAGEIADIVAPQGHIGLIEGDGAAALAPDDSAKLFQKCVGLHFEYMFSRSLFGTADMIRQHEILEAVAGLVNAGKLRTTLMRRLSPINAETLREAHATLESGKSIGKIVIEGWESERGQHFP